MYSPRSTVVKIWEGNFILGSNLISDYDFVDIVELVPIFVIVELVFVERFKLGSSRDRYIQRFCSVETLFVKKIEIVFIYKITQKLVSQAM